MSQKPINFASGQQSDSEPLGGATPLVVNLFVDQTGSMRVRPGISAWDEFPTAIPNASPVVAMAVLNGQLVYACDDRTLFPWRNGTRMSRNVLCFRRSRSIPSSSFAQIAVSMIRRELSIGMSALAPLAPAVNEGFVPRGRFAL